MIGLAWSCKKDDDQDVIVVPPRPLGEGAIEDDAEIMAYLQTHFYNYEEFAAMAADFDYRIKIDTIAGDNSDKTPLSELVSSETILISSSELGLEQVENDIPHKLYYLEARPGTGANPTTVDSLYLRYEGTVIWGPRFGWISKGPLPNPIPAPSEALKEDCQSLRAVAIFWSMMTVLSKWKVSVSALFLCLRDWLILGERSQVPPMPR